MENMTDTATPTFDTPAFDTTTDLNGAAPSRRRFILRRSRTDRMLSGVCGGVAEAFNIDATLVRLGLVALTVLGAGSGALLYIAAWVLVPEADAGAGW